MEARNKWALLLGCFGLMLAIFGEVAYSIVDSYFASIVGIFHNLYYVLISASLLISALVLYKLSYKYKLLQRTFEVIVFFFIAKFGNEIVSRATEFSSKEIIYWIVLALYFIYRFITYKKA